MTFFSPVNPPLIPTFLSRCCPLSGTALSLALRVLHAPAAGYSWGPGLRRQPQSMHVFRKRRPPTLTK